MATIMLGSETQRSIDAQVKARQEQFALQITRYVGWIAGVLVAPLLILWLFSQQYIQLLIFAITLLLAAGVAMTYPIFHRRNRAGLGIRLFLVVCSVVAFMEPILMPRLTSMIVAFVLIFIMGNLVLGDKGSRWLAWVCALAFVADIVLINVWVPSWPTLLDERFEAIISALIDIFALIGTAFIVRLIMVWQEALFRQSQQANLEIEERMVAEQDQRKHLQTTVKRYVEYMAEVARGNLAARLTLDGQGQAADDPLIMLGRNLNETTASLQQMILQIQDAANNLNSAAAEILAATMQQVSGANEQSAAISQTTISVDEVKTIAMKAFAQAQEVTSTSHHTVEVSRSGQGAVQNTIESMAQIKERVEDIAENILALSERTQQIGEIIATVSELASQSNILALNASIEAARAGEQGKGFAVVALEVRNLANQSKQATAQIKTILSEIQKATNSTVMATEEGTKGVDKGVQLAGQARQAIDQLSSVINELAQIATQMMAGGQQQTAGVEQIALAMQNINQATVQSLSSTRQAEKAAQNLGELARSLIETVAQYQL